MAKTIKEKGKMFSFHTDFFKKNIDSLLPHFKEVFGIDRRLMGEVMGILMHQEGQFCITTYEPDNFKSGRSS